jgi:hypothetical protein
MDDSDDEDLDVLPFEKAPCFETKQSFIVKFTVVMVLAGT